MVRRTRSDMRRLRARRMMRPRSVPPSPLDLPRAALGTTERIPTRGEQFLAEYPEANRPLPSPYSLGAWLDPMHSVVRAMSGGELRGWTRRGMIALLLVLLVGAVAEVVRTADTMGEQGISNISGIVFGLFSCALIVLMVVAFARRADSRR